MLPRWVQNKHMAASGSPFEASSGEVGGVGMALQEGCVPLNVSCLEPCKAWKPVCSGASWELCHCRNWDDNGNSYASGLLKHTLPTTPVRYVFLAKHLSNKATLLSFHLHSTMVYLAGQRLSYPGDEEAGLLSSWCELFITKVRLDIWSPTHLLHFIFSLLT